MGPRSVDRGNLSYQEIQVNAAVLQWGRDLLIAETFELSVLYNTMMKLQWGRDLLIAETSHLPGNALLACC